MRSRIAFFFTRYKAFFRRLYWFLLVAAAVSVIAIPIGMSIRNPDVHLLDFHGPSPRVVELRREWDRAMSQARREQGRLNDFVVLVNRLAESYPYLELVATQNSVDHMELAVVVFDELAEVARYETTSGFISNFLTDHYLSVLGSFGGLRLTGEAGGIPRWVTQPYFFGYYDWRFYDDRFDVPVREDNVASEILDDGIVYLRINSFLPKGYEIVSRNPFWYFCVDADTQYLMDVFSNLYGIDDLIIDIRGIGSGFRDYFVPMILSPLLHEPMTARFYAFHADEGFANSVSDAYRAWYGHSGTVDKNVVAQGFDYDLPENVALGFPVDIAVQPLGDVNFEGRVWLLTDSDNFSGPNFMYLQMARDAGFAIVYKENPGSIGWETSSTILPHSGLALRFNPLFFTDAQGRSLEGGGALYDYRLPEADNGLIGMLRLISG